MNPKYRLLISLALSLVCLFPAFIFASDPTVPAWQSGQAVFYDIKVFRQNNVLKDHFIYRFAIVDQPTQDGHFWFETDLLSGSNAQLYFKDLVLPLGGETVFDYLLGGFTNLTPQRVIEQVNQNRPIELLGLSTAVQGSANFKDNKVASQITSAPENITVTAGTFSTVKYTYIKPGNVNSSLEEADLWASSAVPITGMVKYFSDAFIPSPTNPNIQEEITTYVELTSTAGTGAVSLENGTPFTEDVSQDGRGSK